MPSLTDVQGDFRSYDWIVVNTSSGKDSQTALRATVDLAEKAHVLDRLAVAHADLGRIEWEGCKELAEKQAQHYGVQRFWSVARPQGDFIHLVRARRRFPDAANRLCTSSLKREQVSKLFTELTKTLALPKGRPARILNVMGIRAEESPNRAKMIPFEIVARQTNTRRQVFQWYPIHRWSTAEVWSDIKASGVPHHPAYDLGMRRLSCRFCILADKASLMLAGRHAPELLEEYVELEREIGHDFRHKFKIERVKAAIAAGEDWGMPRQFTG